jgi:hypothetical protein
MIEKLQFDQIKYIKQCSEAPHGEIIQTLDEKRGVLVGMRIFYIDPIGGGGESIMIIGGDDNCLLTSLHNIGNPPAVIITKLVRFVATGIAPFVPRTKRPETGNLLQLADGAILVKTEVVLPKGTKQAAYVCLQSGNEAAEGLQPTQRGAFLQGLDSADIRGISQSFELEKNPEPVVS